MSPRATGVEREVCVLVYGLVLDILERGEAPDVLFSVSMSLCHFEIFVINLTNADCVIECEH